MPWLTCWWIWYCSSWRRPQSGHVTLLHGQLLGFVVLQTGYAIACRTGREGGGRKGGREGKKVGGREGRREDGGREREWREGGRERKLEGEGNRGREQVS